MTDRVQERALISRLVEGDDAALREATEAHGAVFGMAAAVLKDLGMAEEVAQDTFLASG